VHVDPLQIVKGTLVAAANMDYPKDKLTICVCDDGRRAGTPTPFSLNTACAFAI
jgi:cellulose synthase/poly-beta-1,6-N-acetylglucosamine synthase-like glycosyltransferase